MYQSILIAAALCGVFAVAPAPAQNTEELAKQVREVETAFAQTMTERNFAAFSEHLSAEAVFFTRQGALRGAEAVAAAWRPYFEDADADAPFSWAPAQVEVLDSGALALSSGPVLDPDGHQVGTFTSIWRLEADGVWRIIFDKGCPPCDCSGEH